MREFAESGAKQFNEFFNDCLKEKKTSIYEIITKNKFAIFTQPSKPNKASNKMEITTLKKSCPLFSRLYIACQVRDATTMSSFYTRMAVFFHLFPKMVTWFLDQSRTSCIALKNSIRKLQPIIWLWIASYWMEQQSSTWSNQLVWQPSRNTQLKISHHTSKNSCKGAKESTLFGTFTSRIPWSLQPDINEVTI